MKPRVLQLIGSFNNGGSERQAVQLCRSIRESGEADVRIATMNRTGVLLDQALAIDSEIEEFAIDSFFSVGFLSQARKCAKFIKLNNIDVVQTHDFYTNVFASAVKIFVKSILHIASKRETGGMRSASQDRIERLAFARANSIVANSDAVRSYLVQKGVDPRKIVLIYNGLETKLFNKPAVRANVVTRLGLPDRPDIKFVTLVANLRHDVKNVPMLLRAAARLKETNLHFLVAGEGELRTSLEAKAAELGVAERVHFVGRCDDVPSLLTISFAGVLTSLNEGFSNSILEYMAAGLPVVATDVGGAAEVVNEGVNGFLVDSDDDEKLADRLSRLANDAEMAAALGKCGRANVIERFSLDAQLRNTIELYNEVLGR